jgi:hypothetical protein
MFGGDIPPSIAGQFPVLQAILGMGALIACFIFWLRGERSKRDNTSPPPPTIAGAQVYIGGPFAEVVNLLTGIFHTLQEIRRDNEEFAGDRKRQGEKMIGLLADIRRRMREQKRSKPS